MGLVEETAAGEDVGLDEVRVADVAVEHLVPDADELQRRPAAALQVAGDAVEIGAPPALPDRFDHLDRSDGVELLRRLAIVLKADFDLWSEAGLRDLPVRPGLLLGREREPDDRCAAPRRLDRKRAPAAADFQQALAGL